MTEKNTRDYSNEDGWEEKLSVEELPIDDSQTEKIQPEDVQSKERDSQQGGFSDDLQTEYTDDTEDIEETFTSEDRPKDGLKKKDRASAGRRRKTGSRNLLRPNDGLLIAFLVPVLVMICIFIQRGIFPFGDRCFLRTDLYHQYAPFFSEFQYKLRSGGSLLYSWDVGMGVNFAALYAYYLASPLNWLILLCPKSYIIEFMTIMIVLKIGLSGLSFAWYLKKHCQTCALGVGFFGIFYALSGYMAAYSWNIMWLDCILLFPVIVYGLERLIAEKKGMVYCVALGLSILSNYYISIMTCLFLVIYFIALEILKKPEPIREYVFDFLRFALYSLLSGGLAAAVLLPEVFALKSTASGDFDFPKAWSSYFSIFDMIARHIGNVETEIGLDHWPNIYCGVAVFLFFLLYLGCQKIRAKEKIVYCGLILIFFASFSINVLNFIWHGFHYPNSLPCRQSFIYIFLMLFICFRAYMHLRETSKKHVAIALWGSICFVLLAQKLVTEDSFHFSVFYVAILFLAAYAGLMYLFLNGKATLAGILALALVSIEAAANTAVTSITTTSRENYTSDNKEVELLKESLESETDFYRIEKKNRKTKNDGAWMNYPSVSLFSSTANADLSRFFKRVGCESSTNAYCITGSTPLIDSIFSVKYALYSEEANDTDLNIYLRESGGTYLYENLYTLPIGFVLPSDIDENWQYDMDNPAEVQNDLCLVMGTDEVLLDAGGMVENNTFSFTADRTGSYYVYVTNKKVKTVKTQIRGENKTFNNVDRGYLLELGNLSIGTEVTLTADEAGEQLNAIAYYFSDNAMIDTYDKLNRMPMHLTTWKDTRLSGNVTADQAGLLFTSIPYDEGWTVKVDGEKTETKKVFGAFLSVDLDAGEHEIEFSYFPKGLKLGIVLTGCSILTLIGIGLFKRKKESEKLRKERLLRYYQKKKELAMPAVEKEVDSEETEDYNNQIETNREELP